jgi:hypothetical protein
MKAGMPVDLNKASYIYSVIEGMLAQAEKESPIRKWARALTLTST